MESYQTAIVHVGCGARDLPQPGRLEPALSRSFVGQLAVTPGDPGVVQCLIREVRANVAGGAVGLTAKDLKAELLLGGADLARARQAISARIEMMNLPQLMMNAINPNNDRRQTGLFDGV